MTTNNTSNETEFRTNTKGFLEEIWQHEIKTVFRFNCVVCGRSMYSENMHLDDIRKGNDTYIRCSRCTSVNHITILETHCKDHGIRFSVSSGQEFPNAGRLKKLFSMITGQPSAVLDGMLYALENPESEKTEHKNNDGGKL